MDLSLTKWQAELALDALIDYHADVLESPRDYERGTADRLFTLISKLERRLDEHRAFGRDANPSGEMGKWEKTADGYYLPGQAVSFLVKKEAIKVRGRRKQMWALYANRHEDAWEKGWKLWFNNIPTLTKAKGIVHEYVGPEEDDRVRRGLSPS